jgi:hypothetical protein
MLALSFDRPLYRLAIACLFSLSAVGLTSTAIAIPPALLSRKTKIVLPAGTHIPLQSLNFNKILLTPGEILFLTLSVSTPLRDRQGLIAIPQGSTVSGELRPLNWQSSQFFAHQLTIITDAFTLRQYPLAATSALLTRSEQITSKTNTVELLQQTLIGRAAATLIAEITGDRTLVSETSETGIGALAGWFLNSGQVELRSINPSRDLTLTLQEKLVLENKETLW